MDHKQTLGELADLAAEGDDLGLRCKACACQHFRVIDSLKAGTGNSVRRVRICRNCGEKMVTRERAVDL